MTASAVFLAALVVILAGCLGSSDARDAGRPVKPKTPALELGVADPTRGTCPLTLPNGRTPPGGTDVGANHGNGNLWTTMWPHDVVIATPDFIDADGSVLMKGPWWRGVEGTLRITGRRLDGTAPRLKAYLA